MMRRIFSFILLLILPLQAAAQSMQDLMEAGGISAQMELKEVEAAQQKEKIVKQLQTQAAQGINVLEGAIDASAYVLGPNDMLTIVLWGELATTWNVVVTAEGRVLLPNVGALDVAGKSLADATEQITAAVDEKYKNVEVTVSLAMARNFKVHVTGNVLQPGTYVATAVERVSQLVIMAGGLMPGASRRNVIVRRNGIDLSADLDGFARGGNKDANLTVLDGDVIVVPAKRDSISIWGEVGTEGYYEYREGDGLADLVRLAGGTSSKAQLNDVAVLRFNSDNTSTTEQTVDAASVLNGMDSFLLQADDRVFIRAIPDYRELPMVAVNGEVKYPGMYPVRKGETRISDVIRMAGGFTDDANLYNASLQRDAVADTNDPDYRRIMELRSTIVTDLEYDYLRTKTRENDGVAAVDFYRLFTGGEKAFDLVLQDKDVITVPRISNTITVSGRVENPGQVVFVAGKSVGYYLKEAGGLGKGAKRGEIRVIKGGKGAWLKKGDVDELGPGDVIWVPEKEEGYWWKRTLEVVSLIGQTTSVLSTIILINSTLGN